jgi:hypothetical protein
MAAHGATQFLAVDAAQSGGIEQLTSRPYGRGVVR